MGGLFMGYVYTITEDVYFLVFRGITSQVAVHDTLCGVEKDLDSYFIKRERMDGYKQITDDYVLGEDNVEIIFSKWGGIMKRVLSISRRPLRD